MSVLADIKAYQDHRVVITQAQLSALRDECSGMEWLRYREAADDLPGVEAIINGVRVLVSDRLAPTFPEVA